MKAIDSARAFHGALEMVHRRSATLAFCDADGWRSYAEDLRRLANIADGTADLDQREENEKP